MRRLHTISNCINKKKSFHSRRTEVNKPSNFVNKSVNREMNNISKRDSNHTPYPNGSDTDQQNGSVGQQVNSPNNFEGFNPNDAKNIDINNIYRAFMRTFGGQSFNDASHNPGHPSHMHTAQSFPDASHSTGQMLRTHTDQTSTDASHNSGLPPHMHTGQNFSIICDGSQHPGSWVVKTLKASNSQINSNTRTAIQTLNTR